MNDSFGETQGRARRVDAAMTTLASAEACGRFAGVGCAQLCFVVPSATGAPRQVVEVTS